MPKIPTTSAPARRTAGFVARGIAVTLFVTLLPGVAAAQPLDRQQSIGSLQDKARKIAAELDDLDQKTNALDEQYNDARLELDKLKTKLAANQQDVDAARAALDTNQANAQKLAVQAYVGSGDTSDLVGVADDAADASRRRTYLASKYGDSEEVISGLVSAQKDLASQEATLEAANAKVTAKSDQISKARDDLQKTIADRQALAESVKGDLATALQAEQDRLDREAAAKAQAEAEAAAARAAAARRPQAVVVKVATPGVSAKGVTTPVVVAQEPAVDITPPPSDAPVAVQTALAQQGDPYLWAASGPDRFDCSGLILFAYKSAGVNLPHSSGALRAMTRSITADQLQPGDLVFGGSPVHHVGLYIGNGQMVHAPHSGDVVRVAGIYSSSKPVSFGRL